MTKAELAANYFEEGYNCAQSVLLAFCSETGLSQKEAAKLASSFGGGIGKLREVCGAISGMLMALGIVDGYDAPDQPERKAAQYALVQRLAGQFKEKNGTIICRELLSNVAHDDSTAVPQARTQQYYQQRPCKKFVMDAAEILEQEFSTKTQEP